MKYIFAGDRAISVHILNFIIDKGYAPEALFVTKGKNTTHDQKLIEASGLPADKIFKGLSFKSPEAIEYISSCNVDYILGIHFPYIIPPEVLSIPKVGVLNLHPSYLPFNKGWNTPSWAILDNKPYGATLHFMSKGLDEGDIINQKEIKIESFETANSLYAKVLALEEDVFKESFNDLLSLNPTRMEQTSAGTSHNKKDLQTIQRIDKNEVSTYGEVIDKLRALTTNNIDDAAYYVEDNHKYAIQITITKKNNER